MDASYRHLAFLMSLGAIPLGCAGDDASSGSDSATTSTTTTDATTSTGTTGDSSTSTAATGTDSDSAATTDASTTASETTGDTTTGGPEGACATWAAKYVECFPGDGSYREVINECETARDSYIDSYGEACGVAFEGFFACLGEASCAALDEQDYDTICPEAYVGVLMSCYPAVEDTCAAFGAKYNECYGEDSPVPAYDCQLELSMALDTSAECGEATEELYVCLTGLDCADFETETGCDAQFDAIGKACG
ncbi:MAG: hypothetical protein R3A79_04340 [Nannocystaceae bacterium]